MFLNQMFTCCKNAYCHIYRCVRWKWLVLNCWCHWQIESLRGSVPFRMFWISGRTWKTPCPVCEGPNSAMGKTHTLTYSHTCRIFHIYRPTNWASETIYCAKQTVYKNKDPVIHAHTHTLAFGKVATFAVQTPGLNSSQIQKRLYSFHCQ